jgi:hypothetical protein
MLGAGDFGKREGQVELSVEESGFSLEEDVGFGSSRRVYA